jgi:hypothetical protein
LSNPEAFGRTQATDEPGVGQAFGWVSEPKSSPWRELRSNDAAPALVLESTARLVAMVTRDGFQATSSPIFVADRDDGGNNSAAAPRRGTGSPVALPPTVLLLGSIAIGCLVAGWRRVRSPETAA